MFDAECGRCAAHVRPAARAVLMVVRFVLWNLADTAVTVEELREYLRDEAVAAFSTVPGLLFKAWISDAGSERWGAVYVFASALSRTGSGCGM